MIYNPLSCIKCLYLEWDIYNKGNIWSQNRNKKYKKVYRPTYDFLKSYFKIIPYCYIRYIIPSHTVKTETYKYGGTWMVQTNK